MEDSKHIPLPYKDCVCVCVLCQVCLLWVVLCLFAFTGLVLGQFVGPDWAASVGFG